MGKGHIAYFDFLRGVAILFVVFCHSYSGNPLDCSFKEQTYLVLRQLVTCAVPIFLAQSGFFLANRVLNGTKEYLSFFVGHSCRIWLPMVIWSLPLFFIQEHNNYILTLLYMFLGGYSIYYYIILIIQFYALQPILRRVNGWTVIFALIINLLFLIIDNCYISLQGNKLPILFECGPFVMWIIYPVIGYYIGKNGRNYKILPWLVLMLLFLFCCVIESKWLYSFNQEGLGATKVSALLFSSCAIIVLFSNKVQCTIGSIALSYRILVYVGEISFAIYLIHKYVLDFLIVPIITDSLLRMLLTIVLSVAIIVFLKRIVPASISRYLGLK